MFPGAQGSAEFSGDITETYFVVTGFLGKVSFGICHLKKKKRFKNC